MDVLSTLSNQGSQRLAGGFQSLLGVGQLVKGLTMPKPDIPDYDIPEEIYQNMTDAEYWSFMGLPDAQKQQFVEQSMRAGATALKQSRDRKGGLGMVSSIAQQERDSRTQMLAMDTEARMRNLQTFWGARERMAQAKDVKFGHKMDKTMYLLAKRDEMIGAGMQNLAGGFSNFIGAGETGGTTSTTPTSSGAFGATKIGVNEDPRMGIGD